LEGSHAVLITNEKEAELFLKQIGVDPAAYPYLIPKALFRCIKLKNIPCRAANIIKQEMLARGGDAAVKREALSFQGVTDVLLMGTLKQYELLVNKLDVQVFGCKKIGQEIRRLLQAEKPRAFTMELANQKTLELGKKTLIMGILNITPDSFSDGGLYLGPEQAIKRGLEMIEEGADIIDIGGASSRPNSIMADADEEINRLLPVVKALAREQIPISVDTWRSRVADLALDNGANFINDIGALKMDGDLLGVLLKHRSPVVLMHNRLQIKRGEPYEDLMSDIITELGESVSLAEKAGLAADKIIVDPGIGFGKDVGQNRLIIKRLKEIRSLGKPVLLGVSRKRFIGATLAREVGERLEGSLATLVMGIINGADIVRVHDVKESRLAAAMTDAVIQEHG
jgi:dihydropteroate synthase